KNKSTLQQKQLDYFEITSNIVQENIIHHLSVTDQNKSLSAKRIQNEDIKSKIAKILQQFDGLSGQSLLRKILEDKLYTLYNDNKHVYCHIIDLTKSNKELNNLATVTVNNNRIEQHEGELTSSIRCKYSHISNFDKWINYSFKELDKHIKNQENHSKKYRFDNLDKLLKYYKKEILDSKYWQLVKEYPILGGLLEAVEEHGIED
ncbi:16437_t:CDS:2, partial [Dentiscutata heterogama]